MAWCSDAHETKAFCDNLASATVVLEQQLCIQGNALMAPGCRLKEAPVMIAEKRFFFPF